MRYQPSRLLVVGVVFVATAAVLTLMSTRPAVSAFFSDENVGQIFATAG